MDDEKPDKGRDPAWARCEAQRIYDEWFAREGSGKAKVPKKR